MSFTWRNDPFSTGCRYKVKKDFSAPRDSFFKDEVLIYDHNAYSIYDSMSGFFFLDSEGNFRAWDLHDDEELDCWTELFDRIN